MRLLQKAFTLIELLIVVAIIAVLAAIAIPNFLEAQVRAKVSKARADLYSIATALEAYRVDNNQYPSAFIITGNNTGYAFYPRIKRFVPLTTPVAYIGGIPKDPFAKGKPDGENCPTYIDQKGYRSSGHFGGDSQAQLNGMIIPFFINGHKQWYSGVKGPSQTRTDLSILDERDYYDPTNGTISPGHIIRWGP